MYNMEELKKQKLLTREEAAFYLGICLASLNKVIHGPGFSGACSYWGAAGIHQPGEAGCMDRREHGEIRNQEGG